MELCFTDRDALVAESTLALVGVLDEEAVPDGMPFVLDTDGSYCWELNRFFRQLPGLGVHSRASWRAYALDVVTWARFLELRRGKGLWDAKKEDVVAFHRVRRIVDPTASVSKATWNRSVAALDKLYRWALGEGLVTELPFTYRWALVLADKPLRIEVNRSREAHSPGASVRFVSLPDYCAFRDLGLRGRLPDGSPDPSSRVRNGERNAAFAELCVTTGARLTEAASLVIPELPAPDDKGRTNGVTLAEAVAKRQRSRDLRVPARVLRGVGTYRRIERSTAVAAAREHGRYRTGGWAVLSQVDRRGGVEAGGARWRWATAHAEHRSRLLLDGPEGPEPAWLWLTSTGLPLRPESWETIFERACQRCARHGIALDVHPHTLRHTYAVHLLAELVRHHLDEAREPADRYGAAYRRMLGDPLRRLQGLLGHASIRSTYVYLDSVDAAQELVDEAIGAWADDVADAIGALAGNEAS
ncbi:MAG: tyrosine-type recombinase/integrase [Acidimicrobiales bacterium]